MLSPGPIGTPRLIYPPRPARGYLFGCGASRHSACFRCGFWLRGSGDVAAVAEVSADELKLKKRVARLFAKDKTGKLPPYAAFFLPVPQKSTCAAYSWHSGYVEGRAKRRQHTPAGDMVPRLKNLSVPYIRSVTKRHPRDYTETSYGYTDPKRADNIRNGSVYGNSRH